MIWFVCYKKNRLEEQQRAVRRQREIDAENATNDGIPFMPYEPLWFKKVRDEDCEGYEHLMHVYKGNYWEAKKKADWSECPQIF